MEWCSSGWRGTPGKRVIVKSDSGVRISLTPPPQAAHHGSLFHLPPKDSVQCKVSLHHLFYKPNSIFSMPSDWLHPLAAQKASSLAFASSLTLTDSVILFPCVGFRPAFSRFPPHGVFSFTIFFYNFVEEKTNPQIGGVSAPPLEFLDWYFKVNPYFPNFGINSDLHLFKFLGVYFNHLQAG